MYILSPHSCLLCCSGLWILLSMLSKGNIPVTGLTWPLPTSLPLLPAALIHSNGHRFQMSENAE